MVGNHQENEIGIDRVVADRFPHLKGRTIQEKRDTLIAQLQAVEDDPTRFHELEALEAEWEALNALQNSAKGGRAGDPARGQAPLVGTARSESEAQGTQDSRQLLWTCLAVTVAIGSAVFHISYVINTWSTLRTDGMTHGEIVLWYIVIPVIFGGGPITIVLASLVAPIAFVDEPMSRIKKLGALAAGSVLAITVPNLTLFGYVWFVNWLRS
jgi:hypothetical protein